MQMAVETNQQRKGIGKLLVVLSFFAVNGIKEIICHARNNAVSFYLNLGFEIYDCTFCGSGIQHYHMRIRVAD
jgi:predicted GNAT family N-acyltransferase